MLLVNKNYSKFLVFNLDGILQLSCLTGASYAFFLGSLVDNQEALANLNTVRFILFKLKVFSIPLLLLSGFFATSDNYAPYLKPFEYISVFKYAYQILTNIEFIEIQPLNCMNVGSTNPIVCDPLKQRFTFLEPMYLSIILICVLIVFFNIIAFIIIYFKSRIKA